MYQNLCRKNPTNIHNNNKKEHDLVISSNVSFKRYRYVPKSIQNFNIYVDNKILRMIL